MESNSSPIVPLSKYRLSTLTSENEKLRSRLGELFSIASLNDRRFQDIAELSLALIECQNLADVDEVIGAAIVGRTLAEHAVLRIAESCTDDNLAKYNHIDYLHRPASSKAHRWLTLEQPVCEACRPNEYLREFDVRVKQPASRAIVPLQTTPAPGYLAIGSTDPHYFSAASGTLFLEYVGKVFERVTQRVL